MSHERRRVCGRRLPSTVDLVALTFAASLAACGSADVTTSVYLEVLNGGGAPLPGQVKIEVYRRSGDGGLGSPAWSMVEAASQSSRGPLGTIVVYPDGDAGSLHLRAEGLLAGQVISQDSVDVTLRPRRQLSQTLTLRPVGAQPDAGVDAGSDAGGGDGGGDAGADAGAEDDAGSGGAAGGGTGGRVGTGGNAGSGGSGGNAGTGGGSGGHAGSGGPTILSIDFVGSGTPMASTESAGVVPATHWNSATSGVGTLTPLVLGGGATSTAAVSWNAGNAANAFAAGLPEIPGDFRMMNGYLDPPNGQLATITVSGLPAAFLAGGYDVYVYGNGSVPGAERRTYNYTIDAVTVPVMQTGAEVFNGTYVMVPTAGGAGNYVLFRGLRGSSFTVTSTPGSSTSIRQRSPVNGLQIVAAPPP